MKTRLIVPAILLGASSLLMSTTALAVTSNTNPVKGVVHTTGNFLTGVGHGAAVVAGGVIHGTGQLISGVAHGTKHVYKKITH